jgi:hypothetical protein
MKTKKKKKSRVEFIIFHSAQIDVKQISPPKDLYLSREIALAIV